MGKIAKTIVALLLFAAGAACAESVYVVTQTDFLGEKTFSVMSREQIKELELKVKRENALLPKVLAEIQSDFRKNPEAHSGEKFFGQKLKPKKITAQGPLDSQKASEKVEKLQEREENKDSGNNSGNKKKKKKLSDAEKEKAFKEAQKEYAIKMFAEGVEKAVAERIAAADKEKEAQ